MLKINHKNLLLFWSANVWALGLRRGQLTGIEYKTHSKQRGVATTIRLTHPYSGMAHRPSAGVHCLPAVRLPSSLYSFVMYAKALQENIALLKKVPLKSDMGQCPQPEISQSAEMNRRAGVLSALARYNKDAAS